MSVYPRVLRLHDVDDVEQLCTHAARRWMQLSSTRLSEHDFESLVSFLIASVFRAGERYDRAKSTSFEAVVRGWITNRCVDWLRSHVGRTRWQFGDRTYEREIPQTISLDGTSLTNDVDGGRQLSAAQLRDGWGMERALADAVASVDGDPQAGLDTDPFGGLLDERDSEADWDIPLCRALARRLLREGSERAAA